MLQHIIFLEFPQSESNVSLNRIAHHYLVLSKAIKIASANSKNFNSYNSKCLCMDICGCFFLQELHNCGMVKWVPCFTNSKI